MIGLGFWLIHRYATNVDVHYICITYLVEAPGRAWAWRFT